ncbi:MAG: hypothetical protein AB7T07_03040 [Steroidobacteraceae bacterium]
MNKYLSVLIAIIFTLVTVAPVTVNAKSRPDWSGYWIRVTDPDNPTSFANGARIPSDGLPALTPEYMEKWKVVTTSLEAGSHEHDPGVACLPPGMLQNMLIPYSAQIEMRPVQVTIITEWAGDTRRIYIDDRGHPEDFDATRQGHSIGRWEGDVLVVDTVGISSDTALNSQLMPHSDQLHVIERFREYKPGFLEIRYHVEDSLALAKPYEYKLIWKRSPYKYHEINEYICSNNRELEQLTGQPASGTK